MKVEPYIPFYLKEGRKIFKKWNERIECLHTGNIYDRTMISFGHSENRTTNACIRINWILTHNYWEWEGGKTPGIYIQRELPLEYDWEGQQVDSRSGDASHQSPYRESPIQLSFDF